jgi:hypothetical protein
MPRGVLTLPVVLLFTLGSTTAAQPTTGGVCPYQSCGVRTQVNFFNEYLVRGDSGERILKINFTGGNAADYLSRVASAAPAARQFRTSRTRAAVLGIIAAGAAGYAIAASSNGGWDGNEFETEEIIAFSIGLSTAIWGGIETARSRNAISRAIWEFNRAPLP